MASDRVEVRGEEQLNILDRSRGLRGRAAVGRVRLKKVVGQRTVAGYTRSRRDGDADVESGNEWGLAGCAGNVR